MFQAMKTFFRDATRIYHGVFELPRRMVLNKDRFDKVKLTPLYEHGKDKPNGYRFDIQVNDADTQGIIRKRKKGNARVLTKLSDSGRRSGYISNQHGHYVWAKQYFNGFMGMTSGETTNGYHFGKRSVYVEREIPIRHFWQLAYKAPSGRRTIQA